MSTTAGAASRGGEQGIRGGVVRSSQGASARAFQADAGLAFLRVIAGIIFIAHGGQKLFSFTIPGVVEGLAAAGVPVPGLTAPAVTLLELFGGIALLAGVFTRIASTGLAVVMLGAIVMVHLPSGFFAPDGIEYPLALFGTMVAFALTGAGRYSVDGLFAGRRSAG
ncbi:MAG: DoxX family membrane protein [Gemmatimonas sp.]|nr:DoxX family membrane protein [Gemmatimonas sp.]